MKPAEEYILNQPEPFKSILLELQVLIEHTFKSNYKLEYKWKIPVYDYKGVYFCYLNASHKKKYVDVGFVKGYQLQSHPNKLIGEKRVMIKSLRYYSISDIDIQVLTDVIEEQMKLY